MNKIVQKVVAVGAGAGAAGGIYLGFEALGDDVANHQNAITTLSMGMVAVALGLTAYEKGVQAYHYVQDRRQQRLGSTALHAKPINEA